EAFNKSVRIRAEYEGQLLLWRKGVVGEAMVTAGGMSMAQVDAALDKVLRPLAGYALYDANVFSITGLPVDATSVQVRRRREEAAMEARFGVSPRADAGDDWRRPETDGEVLRNAFEALRNPVLRPTHEMLW